MLIFATPWALLLLALLPLTAALGRTRLRRLPGRRGVVALAARLLLLGLLVAALCGPEWRAEVGQVSTVFLVDASASVGADGQRTGMTWAMQANKAAGARDQAAVALFGAAPRLAVPLAHYADLRDPATTADGATDIGAALRMGLALLPPETTGRVVLLSDGQATTGDTNGAIAEAVARGVTVDTVAVPPAHRRDALVSRLDVPATTRVGEQVPIHITLRSTYATTATLSVWIDGREAQQTVQLPVGDTVLRTEQRLDTAGLHTFRVRVDAPGDTTPQNNALDAATVAEPPGRVLLVVGDPAAATGLGRALARARLDIRASLPSGLPATVAGYHGYDTVVLDDVPATAIGRAAQRALRDAVHDDGLGLVTIGGPSAFGDGGYPHTALEDALPVLSVSTPRRVGAPLSLMLVIDKSGSMADDVAGVAKVDMVKVAAASALDRLSDGDAVGVLTFDDTNHWLVPFHTLQGAADKARIRHQIASLDAGGDTYIYPALQAARSAVVSVNTPYRHIVLLTDGQGEDAPFDALIRRMQREHITLSTIGVGQDVVQDELRHWAKLGGGVFHYVSDPHQIPRIILNETHYGTTGSTEVRGNHIRLGVGSASTLLRALSGRTLPTVRAYDSAAPRATAQVAVQDGSGDPLLSSWQYGLGRAVAWTSDTGTEWAPAWSPTRLPRFWVDLVQWAMRAYSPSSALPQLTMQGDRLLVARSLRTADGGFDDTATPRVRVAGPDGTAQVLSLSLRGPGYYAASVATQGPGVYVAAPVRNDRGLARATDVTALAVPYGAEYGEAGADTAFLTHLAEATGGRALTTPADAFAHDGLPPAVEWTPLWPLLLLLALLLFPLDIALRLLVPPAPRYTSARG